VKLIGVLLLISVGKGLDQHFYAFENVNHYSSNNSYIRNKYLKNWRIDTENSIFFTAVLYLAFDSQESNHQSLVKLSDTPFLHKCYF